jgi:hypothetical protein
MTVAQRDAAASYAEPLAELLAALPAPPSCDRAARLAKAFRDIKFCIDVYRSEQAKAPEPDVRSSLDGMQKATTDLAAQIRRFGVHELNLLGFRRNEMREAAIGFGVHNLDALRDYFRNRRDCPDIETLADDLECFARRLVCEQAWAKRKPGRKTTPGQFVRMLIVIIESYTGHKIENSENKGTPAEVIRKIVRVAAPEIGAGTIDGAYRPAPGQRPGIKQQKRRRRGIKQQKR